MAIITSTSSGSLRAASIHPVRAPLADLSPPLWLSCETTLIRRSTRRGFWQEKKRASARSRAASRRKVPHGGWSPLATSLGENARTRNPGDNGSPKLATFSLDFRDRWRRGRVGRACAALSPPATCRRPSPWIVAASAVTRVTAVRIRVHTTPNARVPRAKEMSLRRRVLPTAEARARLDVFQLRVLLAVDGRP